MALPHGDESDHKPAFQLQLPFYQGACAEKNDVTTLESLHGTHAPEHGVAYENAPSVDGCFPLAAGILQVIVYAASIHVDHIRLVQAPQTGPVSLDAASVGDMHPVV